MVYAQWFSELPTTFAKARSCKKGDLKMFDSIVKAREFGVKKTEQSGVVIIYSKNPERYLYAINNPLQNPHILGYVDNKKWMGWHYWNVPDKTDRNTGEVYFKSRPVYPNGKMAGRF